MGQHAKPGKPASIQDQSSADIDYSRLRRRRRSDDLAQQKKAQDAKDHSEVGQQGNIRQNTHNQGYQQDR